MVLRSSRMARHRGRSQLYGSSPSAHGRRCSGTTAAWPMTSTSTPSRSELVEEARGALVGEAHHLLGVVVVARGDADLLEHELAVGDEEARPVGAHDDLQPRALADQRLDRLEGHVVAAQALASAEGPRGVDGRAAARDERDEVDVLLLHGLAQRRDVHVGVRVAPQQDRGPVGVVGVQRARERVDARPGRAEAARRHHRGVDALEVAARGGRRGGHHAQAGEADEQRGEHPQEQAGTQPRKNTHDGSHGVTGAPCRRSLRRGSRPARAVRGRPAP